MKRRGLILLLLSGCVMVCHLQSNQFISQFHLVDLAKSWNDAQQYCRNESTDLAIINSSVYIQEAQKEVGNREVWIGLFKSSWKWSQTGLVQPYWYQNWDWGQSGTGECVTTSKWGQWSSRSCLAKYYFFCYNSVTNSHILVKITINWSDAQSYCREKYTDLSTIDNWSDTNKITNLMLLEPPIDVWIGLYRNYWVWSDWSKPSKLNWEAWQPDDNVNCATMVGSTGHFYSHNCNDQRPFLCYRDSDPPFSPDVNLSMSRSVKLRLRAGSADLNNPTVQESILQQVSEKLAEQGTTDKVKLRWKTQPDGKVFHKEEERAHPSDCKMDGSGTV